MLDSFVLAVVEQVVEAERLVAQGTCAAPRFAALGAGREVERLQYCSTPSAAASSVRTSTEAVAAATIAAAETAVAEADSMEARRP